MREEAIHIALCHWLRTSYPDIIFFSDGSGLRLPMGLAVKASKLKSCRGIPDLFICAACHGYSGLFVEIKRSRDTVYKKNGDLRKNKHVEEQVEVMERLRKAGYAVTFGLGLDDSIEKIQEYLNETG